jgi:hypothetical protein
LPRFPFLREKREYTWSGKRFCFSRKLHSTPEFPTSRSIVPLFSLSAKRKFGGKYRKIRLSAGTPTNRRENFEHHKIWGLRL